MQDSPAPPLEEVEGGHFYLLNCLLRLEVISIFSTEIVSVFGWDNAQSVNDLLASTKN